MDRAALERLWGATSGHVIPLLYGTHWANRPGMLKPASIMLQHADTRITERRYCVADESRVDLDDGIDLDPEVPPTSSDLPQRNRPEGGAGRPPTGERGAPSRTRLDWRSGPIWSPRCANKWRRFARWRRNCGSGERKRIRVETGACWGGGGATLGIGAGQITRGDSSRPAVRKAGDLGLSIQRWRWRGTPSSRSGTAWTPRRTRGCGRSSSPAARCATMSYPSRGRARDRDGLHGAAAVPTLKGGPAHPIR
jgi:hypothetical protein